MIEVHHLNHSRSQRILWLLEELSLPYTIVHYQREQTMAAPASLKAVHPLGKSPVIRDGDRTIAESGAIIEYLIERHGNGKLVPPRESRQFDRYLYWLHYAEGSLMLQLLVKFYLQRAGEAAQAVAKGVDAQIATHMDFIERELGEAPFLAGAELTAADIQMSFPLEFAASRGILTDRHPRLLSLLKRMHARPAYQRALEQGGPYAYGGAS